MTTIESAEPEVRTAAGGLRGRREDDLTVFRGIPFAEPPVGEARFRAPRPVRKWDGVREAFTLGPPPPQESGFQGRSRTVEFPAGDDWLTVNVWTPAPDPPPGHGVDPRRRLQAWFLRQPRL
jgi:para-nitrobenzyl esterase